MYIDESLLKKVQELTTYHFVNPILEDETVSMIEELVNEIEHLKEELKDLEQNIEDNYRPIPVSEQVGISDRDFI